MLSLSAVLLLALGGSRTLVVLGDHSELPGFAENLRIQLSGSTEVRFEAGLGGSSMLERLAQAKEQLAQGATLAVWVETRSGRGMEVALYAISRRQDLAVVRTAQGRSGEPANELSRALAVSVGEFLDSALLERKEPPRALPPASAPTPLAGGPSPSQLSRRAAALGVGIGSGFSSTSVWWLDVAIGARYGLERVNVEAWAELRLPASSRAVGAEGLVRADEWACSLSLRALSSAGRVRPGGFLGVTLRRLHAEAVATDGRSGLADRTLPTLSVGPELRTSLAPAIELRAMAGAEVMLRRQRFEVEGEALLDYGVVRPIAGVTLLVSTQ